MCGVGRLLARPRIGAQFSNAPGLFTVLMVDLTRFELVTSRLSAGRSNQLSYRSIMVEVRGIEPLTSGLQSPRSPS